MRHHFPAQPDLQITPIEKIRLPLKSRDELPPLLAGLQWLWMRPTLKAEIFALLEAKIRNGSVPSNVVFSPLRWSVSSCRLRKAKASRHAVTPQL